MNKLSVGLLALTVIASGCGKGGKSALIKDVSLDTRVDDGDQFVTALIDINTGNFDLPAVNLPITRGGQEVGSIALKDILGGGSELALDVNLTLASGLDTDNAELPNGNSLPVGNLSNAAVLSFDINQAKNSKAYLAIGGQTLVLGAALGIKQLDKVDLPVDVFKSFKLKNGIVGTAGFYFGDQAGENGFAVFLDASSVIDSASMKSMAMQEKPTFLRTGKKYEDRLTFELLRLPRQLKVH